MLCVIGCGNATRSDDGVGVYVAQGLLRRQDVQRHEAVRVFDAGTAGMQVMFHARGARRLILVDAARSGSQPGSIFRVPGAELEQIPDPGYSLHDFRWQHALAAGRRLFGSDFPSDTTVYLIEAHSLAFGLELSAPVAASARTVEREILGLIARYQDRGSWQCEVTIARGNLYLSRELCKAYLPNAESVALLRRDAEILILPLTAQSGGGLLLKQRNARGDRVVHAQEFFREQGLPEAFESRSSPVHWSPARAALVVRHGLV